MIFDFKLVFSNMIKKIVYYFIGTYNVELLLYESVRAIEPITKDYITNSNKIEYLFVVFC